MPSRSPERGDSPWWPRASRRRSSPPRSASPSASSPSSSTTTSSPAWSASTPRSASEAAACSKPWRRDGERRMALSTTGGRRRSIMADINVTPLTDVFLVLLIIFMITTSAMIKPEGVDLPQSNAEEQEQKGVMVTMTPSREIFVNDRPVPSDEGALASVLKDALAHTDEKVVILAGDRDVVLGEVVRVLGLAQEAGAKGFALASE